MAYPYLSQFTICHWRLAGDERSRWFTEKGGNLLGVLHLCYKFVLTGSKIK